MKDIQRKEGTRKGKEPASASEFPKKISVTLSFFKPVFFLNSRCVAGEKERNAQKKKISQTNCIFFSRPAVQLWWECLLWGIV
jgi:hypothetical protein